MRIRIEVDDRIEENEIIVRCSELNDEVKNIQKLLAEILSQSKQIIFYKGNTEYYISLDEILFFETEICLVVFMCHETLFSFCFIST